MATGEQLAAAPGAVPAVTTLPDDGAAFGALRRVTVGALSWTLFYPEVLVGAEAAPIRGSRQAARLLVAGQREQAEALLAAGAGRRASRAGWPPPCGPRSRWPGGDAAAAERQAAQAVALAPDAAAPQLAQSYARQLALDLDGAVAAATEAARAGARRGRCRRRGWPSST